jgi:hypothetical protein
MVRCLQHGEVEYAWRCIWCELQVQVRVQSVIMLSIRATRGLQLQEKDFVNLAHQGRMLR